MDLSKLLAEIAAENNKSDMLNGNKGSDGTNITYDKAQGNRGKQMNSTWRRNESAPAELDGDDIDGDVYGPCDGSD